MWCNRGRSVPRKCLSELGVIVRQRRQVRDRALVGTQNAPGPLGLTDTGPGRGVQIVDRGELLAITAGRRELEQHLVVLGDAVALGVAQPGVVERWLGQPVSALDAERVQ